MEILKLFLNKRLLTIFFLGFSSGLPLMLTLSTLTIWLSRLDISRSSIGLFAAVGIPYTIKFLWSFVFDHCKVPLLTDKFGRRVSWMLVIQVFLMISIIMLGYSDPKSNLFFTAFLAFTVAFFSSSQDIIIDAYRIELLEVNEQAAGAAMNTYGYRIGMLLASSGALFLSDILEWSKVYSIIASFMVIGMVSIYLMGEPRLKISITNKGVGSLKEKITDMLYIPLLDFTKKEKWLAILLFIIFFKISDALLVIMAGKFYVEVGFSNTQIGLVVKTFGLIMTLLGSFLGAYLSLKLGNIRALYISGVLQAFSNLIYLLLVKNGDDLNSLYVVIAIENLSGALGSVVIVAYLSSLCNIKFTATQYALLSSLSAIGRTIFAMPAGFIVDSIGWSGFFISSAFAGIPGVFILYYINRETKKNKNYIVN